MSTPPGRNSPPQTPSSPVGDGAYVVQQGECVESIAFASGMTPEKIWNHPQNLALKQARRDLNILLPGDRLYVPDLELKWVEAATDARRTFCREALQTEVKIRIAGWAQVDALTDDDSPQSKPPQLRARNDIPYILFIEGESFSGRTDADGWITHSVSSGARRGKLTLEPGTERAYELSLLLGGLDPIESESGVCQRLVHLGFASESDLQPGSQDFADAIQAFQAAHGLEPSGTCDADTSAKLKDLHRS